MRTGKLYINNLDAYTEYGVFLAKDRGGTYDNISVLMTPPPAKKHTTIDYRECDGEEVDVSGVRFDSRRIPSLCHDCGWRTGVSDKVQELYRCPEIRHDQYESH